MSDHDLLVTISVKLERALVDIANIGKEVYADAQRLSLEKLDKREHELGYTDHEKRLRKIEKYVWGAIAVMGALEFVLTIIAAVHK